MTSYLVPDRATGRVRDLDLDSHVKRSHSHRERLIVECTEPLVLSANILRDPGFELMQGLTGKTEIPELNLLWSTLTWQDSAVAPATVGWANQAYTNAAFWDLSSVGPETGTWSARIDGTTGTSTSTELAVIGLNGCGDGDFYSGRCAPSNFTRAACRAIVDSTAGTPYLDINMEWWREDGSFIDSADLLNAPLTTSYATYQTSGVAPAESYFLRVYYSVANETNRIIYLDNAVLEVT